jgi:hypothetical protein
LRHEGQRSCIPFAIPFGYVVSKRTRILVVRRNPLLEMSCTGSVDTRLS